MGRASRARSAASGRRRETVQIGANGEEAGRSSVVAPLLAHHEGPGGTDTLGALSDLRAIRAEVEALVGVHVQRARRQGRSWTEIGYHLGVSAQAVQKRYGDAK